MSSRIWKTVDGDNTLALDWPINGDSVVWEIGGYEGRWAAQIQEKFNPELFIFEPQKWAYEKLLERFKGTKAHVFPFGLWTHDAVLSIKEYETDGASVVMDGGRKTGDGLFVDVYNMLKTDVDVCLMNIEGGEFVLIPYLIGMDSLMRFKYFWCQFHPGLVKRGHEKARILHREIGRTHNLLWDYYPTAVAWERK